MKLLKYILLFIFSLLLNRNVSATQIGIVEKNAILTNFTSTSKNTNLTKLSNDLANAPPTFKIKIINNTELIEAWELAISRPLYRKNVQFLEGVSELMDPSILNKLPNGQTDLDGIISALAHPIISTNTTILKTVAEHLDDVKHLVNNFYNVYGFNQVITALKNPNFFAQDGVSFLLTKLKTLNANDVAKLEGKIIDADNLSGICTNCRFDIELSNGIRLELKSYKETTIANISNSTQFKNQFKSYLSDANSFDDFEYIFNGAKTQNLTLIKENFKVIFSENNFSIFNEIGGAQNSLMQSLGIINKTDFIDAVADLGDDLYKFIKIE